MAAVRITSGPLRGVELETGVRGPAGRLMRRARHGRRRRPLGRAPVLSVAPAERQPPTGATPAARP